MKKLLLIITLFTSVTLGYCASTYPDMTVPEVKAAIESKSAVILDVNGAESYKEGHVPGAIDYATNKDKLAELLPPDKSTLIVAYCGSPKCKAYLKAANAAKELGYTNIKHMSAGIAGWKEAKQPTEKAQ